MNYVAEIIGFSEMIEEEVIVSISGFRLVGMISALGPPIDLEVGKKYLVELDLWVEGDDPIKESSSQKKEMFNIAGKYKHILTGWLDFENGQLESSLAFYLGKGELYDIWYLEDKYVDVMVDRIDIAFMKPVMETITLYSSVGQKELDLIRASHYCAFPPRLSFQPMFYPILNEEYAIQIARDWNAIEEECDYVGYVTRFQVRKEFINRYTVQTVVGIGHQEYWIPAEDLEEFNQHIEGVIEVIAEFR
ncbi:hypothetical protein [Baia soyae]|uniref:Uncharacterized protein n=1 Tax=Baia soyae TaxID=1544746 RepID=A0A4R2RN03_9BACL|nr:hypothetical protein [Baia soyae]TCP64414.1 hypothetical protein EDD57_1406 [Baia soyae]